MPRRERLHNNSLTTLDGGINASVTTVTVADGTLFPSEGDYRVIVNEEIMLVTARSGNDLTVVRGSEDTTAAIQADGAACRCILTSGALDQWANDMVPGYSDQNAMRLLDDTGATLTSSSFGWFQQTATQTASVTDETWGGITMNIGQDTTVAQLVGMAKSMTAPYTVTAKLKMGLGYAATDTGVGTTMGIMFRESSTDKMLAAGVRIGAGCFCWKMTDANTYSTTPGTTFSDSTDEIWFQLEDDSTNVYLRASHDGINFTEMFSEGRTVWPTSSFNQCGFFADSYGSQLLANGGCDVHINSWVEE